MSSSSSSLVSESKHRFLNDVEMLESMDSLTTIERQQVEFYQQRLSHVRDFSSLIDQFIQAYFHSMGNRDGLTKDEFELHLKLLTAQHRQVEQSENEMVILTLLSSAKQVLSELSSLVHDRSIRNQLPLSPILLAKEGENAAVINSVLGTRRPSKSLYDLFGEIDSN